MNPIPHTALAAIHNPTVIPLLLLDIKPQSQPHDSSWVLHDLEVRATKVGSVLEGILQAPHGEPRWGLNE